MTEPDAYESIYACVAVTPERDVQVGPVNSNEEALVVEEVMRERLAELVEAEDLIHEVDGQIVGTEQWDTLHGEVLREGRARYRRRSPAQ